MKTPLILLCSLLLTGCTTAKYGEFSISSFGTRKSFAELEVVINGDKKTLKVKGYKNDQVEIAGAIAEGVAKGFKPIP